MSCVFGFGTRLLFGSVRRGNNSNLRLDGSCLNLRTVCVNTNTRGKREGRGHKTRLATHHTIALNTNARLALNTNARYALNTNVTRNYALRSARAITLLSLEGLEPRIRAWITLLSLEGHHLRDGRVRARDSTNANSIPRT